MRLAASLLLWLPGSAQLLSETYHSPDGRLLLSVEALSQGGVLRMDGGGAARYHLTQGPETLWSLEHPFVLQAVAVSDEGRVHGFAYPGGMRASRVHRSPGEFLVVGLNEEGRVYFEDRTVLEEIGQLCLVPAPYPQGRCVVLHTEIDRLFVPLKKASGLRTTSWRAYRLSTGERLPDGLLTPRELHEEELELRSARPIPSTGLTLISWHLSKRGPLSVGSLFSLHDKTGEAVWTLERPEDIFSERAWGEGGTRGDRLAKLEFVREHGLILEVGNVGSFDLWFPTPRLRVRYQARNEDGRWDAQRVERGHYAPANWPGNPPRRGAARY